MPRHKNPADMTILFVDIATNGYNPQRDLIMEVACILASARTFEVLDTTNTLVRVPEGTEAPDFHADLLKRCLSPEAPSRSAAEGFLCAGPWTTADVLCNRALDFDIKFLQAQMPSFYKGLPRTHIELKAIEMLAVARGKTKFASATPRTWRAGDDVIAAYEEMVFYLEGGVL